MHDQLTEIAVVIMVALLGGIALSRLRQPPVLGYILTGIILGPSCFSLIHSRDQVSVLAELGVLLLLFVIGMELSLRNFKRVWVVATICTLCQVFLSIFLTLGLSYFFGWSTGLSLLLGFVTALSSTAVVFKMMESIGELKTETGHYIIGILIAQDLAVVPMILILRNSSSGQHWFSWALVFKILLSIGMIVSLISYLSQRQRVRVPLARIVAGEKDLTPLASLAFCFAAAAASGMIGLSAPYGAFLAGLILGNTHERIILIESTKPIQSILLMAFFLSIGLLLDLQFIWTNLWVVLALLMIITVGKTAMNIGILRLLRMPWSQAFCIGVVLAQLGEFAFLMATIGFDSGIINEFGERLIIGITALSLAFSPIWMIFARRLRDLLDLKTISLRTVIDVLLGRAIPQELTPIPYQPDVK